MQGTSVALFDPWSFVHVAMGTIQFFLFPPPWLNLAIPFGQLLALNVAIHAVFEIIERLPCAIKCLRALEPEYVGDTVLNSTGDVLCASVGYSLAFALWRVNEWIVYALPIVFLAIHILFYPAMPFGPEQDPAQIMFYLNRLLGVCCPCKSWNLRIEASEPL